MTLTKSTPQGNLPMTKDEEAAFMAEQSSLTAANASTDLKAQVKVLLDASDLVFIRCGKAGVAWPSEWQAYVVLLRAIVDSGAGDIPVKPSYPANT